jgi:hypothetical protein
MYFVNFHHFIISLKMHRRSNVKILKNTKFTNQFQNTLVTYFYYTKVFKCCIQQTLNTMEV